MQGLTVIAEGFEPSTASLEGRCSIQLSYATIFIVIDYTRTLNLRPSRLVGMVYPAELRDRNL